jgi:Flp pilus assembly protein TadD
LFLLSLPALMAACHSTGIGAHEADERFETSSDRAPTSETLYTSAQLLSARGRDQEAYWVYQRIVHDYPNYAPGYNGLAEHQMRTNHTSEAAATLRSGLAVAPNDSVLLNNLGMCNMMQADYEQALANFTKAAGNTPGNARYRSNMGAALGMMGRYDESLAVYQQVVGELDAHYNVGVLAESRGDNARAEMEFARANEGKAQPTAEEKKPADKHQPAPPPKDSTPMYVMPKSSDATPATKPVQTPRPAPAPIPIAESKPAPSRPSEPTPAAAPKAPATSSASNTTPVSSSSSKDVPPMYVMPPTKPN